MQRSLRVAAIPWLIIGIVGCRETPTSSTALSDSAVAEIVRERVESGQNAAIVVGILENGERRTIAHGARVAGGDRVDANTVFEIGSITKVFTATLLAAMVQRGEVRLDDPIAMHLPSTVRVPSRDDRQITLLDLATHHSGLPRLPGNLRPADGANPYADYTAEKLHDFLSTYTLPRAVGEKFEYSNLGVGLLGHILALRAGTEYETALRQRVLDPLGLHDTRITLSPALAGRLATGHTARGSVAKNWDLEALAGAGALRSTANDLLSFAAAHFDSGSALAPELRMTLQSRRAVAASGSDSIGLNWMLIRVDGRTVAWHNGGTGGYRSFLGIDPERKRAVVVLTSSATSADDLGMRLLRDEGSRPRRSSQSVAAGGRFAGRFPP